MAGKRKIEGISPALRGSQVRIISFSHKGAIRCVFSITTGPLRWTVCPFISNGWFRICVRGGTKCVW